MRRREFITLLSGAALTWPRAARALEPATPAIGFVGSSLRDASANRIAAFRQGLAETGYVEGGNVTIEHRWAEGHYDRLPALANDLVRRQVAMIFAAQHNSALAAKAATATIPVVFLTGADPVVSGLVANFNRPAGNVTGVSMFSADLDAKRLGLLHDLVPDTKTIAALVNPSNASATHQSRKLIDAAGALGLQLHLLEASSERDFETAFATLVQMRAGGLAVAADPFFASEREQLVGLAARHKLPAVYEWRDFAEAGGLMSYATSLMSSFRQAGVYTGRILKGEKAGELPVVQPTKFELVINLKTAKALGLAVSDKLLALADEVIE
jgi:putative tryptophan/tyrosine transport system substrate-binding protein